MPCRISHKTFRSCCAGIAAICLLAVVPPVNAATTIAAGTAFPDLESAGLEGGLPDLSQARVVIVDFWASWCGPCKASFPVYNDLQKQFASQGVVVLAVSVDKDAKAMNAFLQRNTPSFTVVRDAKQQLVKAAGVPTMPTSFVLDAKGIVRFVHAGFHNETSHREYLEEITSLLEEKI